MIDNLDASMMMMSTALALVDKGEMTNKIFAMDTRVVSPCRMYICRYITGFVSSIDNLKTVF
ncbi:cmp-binding-factor 1 [Streptococcus pneumoniae]|nr:cmp-binding-factor 1 [Streptococcus pneumoniae]